MTKTELNTPAYWNLASEKELAKHSPVDTEHWLKKLAAWEKDASKIRARFEIFSKNVSGSTRSLSFLKGYTKESPSCFLSNCLGHELRFEFTIVSHSNKLRGEVISFYQSGDEWIKIRSLIFKSDGVIHVSETDVLGATLEIHKGDACQAVIAYLVSPPQCAVESTVGPLETA